MPIIKFNISHYEKVRSARLRLGIKESNLFQRDINPSQYLGKHLTDSTNGRTYLVERDYMEYSYLGCGWFKVLLLNCDGDHRVIFYDNINNEAHAIIDRIYESRRNFNLVPLG